MDATDLRKIFDRVDVLSMPRRQDRWDKFQANISQFHWPFKTPNRFNGIDGWKLPLPRKWGSGMAGAYGCLQGHVRILEQAIIDDVPARGGAVLVIEDDASFRPSFPEEFRKFYQHVPADWQFLFLGGQSNGNLRPVNENVAAVGWANRWHCYAVRGQLITELYEFLRESNGHCDLTTWPFLRKYKVYAPYPQWLSCQAPSWSDIASTENTYTRCWDDAPPSAAVVYLRTPREVAEEFYRMGLLHPGFNRDAATGVDCWLRDQIKQHGRTGAAAIGAIAGFLNGLKGEALGIGIGVVAALWEPSLPPETARAAIGKHIIEVEARTITEAIEKLLDATAGDR